MPAHTHTHRVHAFVLLILGCDVCLLLAGCGIPPGVLPHPVCQEPQPPAGSRAEIYTVPAGIPSGAPLVNFGSPACCQALTTILALVFDNSRQVVFHRLLFWLGRYGRNASGCLAGISREGDLLLLCNVTFQSVLGIEIMGCHLLPLLNVRAVHLLYRTTQA